MQALLTAATATLATFLGQDEINGGELVCIPLDDTGAAASVDGILHNNLRQLRKMFVGNRKRSKRAKLLTGQFSPINNSNTCAEDVV